jgi:hypothetical protein
MSDRSIVQTRQAMLAALSRMEVDREPAPTESSGRAYASGVGNQLGDFVGELLSAKTLHWKAALQDAAQRSPKAVMAFAFGAGLLLRVARPYRLVELLPVGVVLRQALTWSGVWPLLREISGTTRLYPRATSSKGRSTYRSCK